MRLGGVNDVLNGTRMTQSRKRDRSHVGAQTAQFPYRLFRDRAHGWIAGFAEEIIVVDADPHTTNVPVQSSAVIRNRLAGRCQIGGVMSGDHSEQQRAIPHG